MQFNIQNITALVEYWLKQKRVKGWDPKTPDPTTATPEEMDAFNALPPSDPNKYKAIQDVDQWNVYELKTVNADKQIDPLHPLGEITTKIQGWSHNENVTELRDAIANIIYSIYTGVSVSGMPSIPGVKNQMIMQTTKKDPLGLIQEFKIEKNETIIGNSKQVQIFTPGIGDYLVEVDPTKKIIFKNPISNTTLSFDKWQVQVGLAMIRLISNGFQLSLDGGQHWISIGGGGGGGGGGSVISTNVITLRGVYPSNAQIDFDELFGDIVTINSQMALKVDLSSSQTLVNKTLNGSNNTFSNIPESAVTNLATDLGSKVTANPAIAGASHTKITYDTKGLVTGGTSLIATDLPAHNHAGTEITSGVIDPSHLATGAPDGTKFLRDDGTWQVVPGSSAGPSKSLVFFMG